MGVRNNLGWISSIVGDWRGDIWRGFLEDDASSMVENNMKGLDTTAREARKN